MRFLVLPWGILCLPWGFWFCRDSCGPPYCKILRLPIRVTYPWKVLSQIVLKKLSACGPPQIMATWKCGVRKASHNDIDDSLVWNQHITWWLVTNRRSACSVILCICGSWPSRCEAVVFTGNLSQHNPILPASWHQVLVFPFRFVDCRITSRLTLLEVSSDRSGNLQLYILAGS